MRSFYSLLRIKEKPQRPYSQIRDVYGLLMHMLQ
jgi:hypothetical protein